MTDKNFLESIAFGDELFSGGIPHVVHSTRGLHRHPPVSAEHGDGGRGRLSPVMPMCMVTSVGHVVTSHVTRSVAVSVMRHCFIPSPAYSRAWRRNEKNSTKHKAETHVRKKGRKWIKILKNKLKLSLLWTAFTLYTKFLWNITASNPRRF